MLFYFIFIITFHLNHLNNSTRQTKGLSSRAVSKLHKNSTRQSVSLSCRVCGSHSLTQQDKLPVCPTELIQDKMLLRPTDGLCNEQGKPQDKSCLCLTNSTCRFRDKSALCPTGSGPRQSGSLSCPVTW